MIIELPDASNWRIEGQEGEWTLRCYQDKGGRGGSPMWRPMYFYPHLRNAVDKAYELSLVKLDEKVSIEDVPAVCKRTADRLLKAVEKAVSA